MNRIVLANYTRDVGCCEHRIHQPAKALSRNTSTIVRGCTDTRLPTFNDGDIVWFNRVPTFDLDLLLKRRISAGLKIVVDIDDHWILYPHHEMAPLWAKSKVHEQIQRCLSEADMVFTTNERLKVAAGHLNSNVHVVPNALLFEDDQFTLTRETSPKVRIVYAGGSSHYHDLFTIAPLFKRLGNDPYFQANGEILLAGYNPSYGMARIESVWEKMLGLIRPSKNYKVLQNLCFDMYMLAYKNADIVLAPLERSSFNACKSNLKVLEAGCKGIPIIASNVEPYVFDSECPGVILCDTPKEWHEAIKLLMEDVKLRTTLGKQLADYVRNKYHLRRINETRRRLFESLDN